MPSRIPSGLVGDPHRLKALILSRPSVVEEGFRVLDVDLGAGAAGAVDVVGADGAGCLALLAVAGRDGLDAVLLRLIDQHLWATEQRGLLHRLYASAGLAADGPLRCLLLAPAFTESFLRRLSLFTVPVTALLVRPIPAGGETEVLIEPAAPIFGLEEPAPRISRRERPEESSTRTALDRPRSDRASADHGSADRAPTDPVSSDSASSDDTIPVAVAAELVAPADLDRDEVLEAFLKEGDAAGPFETLTAEEMEEFERFDRHRRQRDRNPA
jgi:hypothetical protein